MRSDTHEIILTLEGDIRQFDAIGVADSLRHLAQLVESFPTHEGKAKLAMLQEGSAVTGVLTNDQTSVSLTNGMIYLRDKERVPKAWSIAQVRSLRKILETTVDSNRASLKIADHQPFALDTAMRDAIRKALTRIPKSIGSVVGELTRYNGAGHTKTAGLEQENTSDAVEISLGEELWQLVTKYMHQRVEIAGIVTRHPETNAIEKVRARSITKLPPQGARVSGLGIWESIDSYAQAPEEIVRQLRDG